MSPTRSYDVVVIGAGPGGSMAARACARRGARVLLVDRASFPRWKVCGACLGPGGLQALHRAGLQDLPGRLGAVPLVSFSLAAGARTARMRLHGNVALSRAVFDHALVGEAVAAGATFRPGTKAHLESVRPGDDHRRVRLAPTIATGEDGEVVSAAVVVDASGLSGGIGEERPRIAAGSKIGVGAVFADAPADVLPGDLHMTVGAAGYVGFVRDESGRLNVAAAIEPAAVAERGIAGALQGIVGESRAGIVFDGRPDVAWKGTPALTRRRRRLAEHRLFRVGDAGGYVEPFTGEGMGWALSSGLDVAGFVLRGLDGWSVDVAVDWDREQARRMARSQRFCRLLAGGLRRPGLVRASVRVLERYPAAARPLVAAGSLPVRP